MPPNGIWRGQARKRARMIWEDSLGVFEFKFAVRQSHFPDGVFMGDEMPAARYLILTMERFIAAK